MAEKDEIFRISSLVESLLRRAGEQLVCRGEDLVLALIERSGGACTPGELSKLACVSTARIAAVLNSLSRKGLVTRCAEHGSGRRTIVSLTSYGRQYAEAICRQAEEVLGAFIDYLGDDDTTELVRLLTKAEEFLKKDTGTLSNA